MLISVVILVITLCNSAVTVQRCKKECSSKHMESFQFTNLTFSHAESPVFDAQKNTLYWVDVCNQNVHAMHYGDWKHRVNHIEYGQANVVIPVANSDRLLVSVRSELFLMDWATRGDAGLRLVSAVDMGKPDNVINEGKADANGRFWGGTKGPQKGDRVQPDEAILFSLERPWLSPQIKLKPVTTSNGLAWSLNNSLLYYIDSETKTVDAFDYNLTSGTISKRRHLLDIRKLGYSKAQADGLTIDRDGMLWIALIFGGSVIRFDPNTRRILEKYELPITRPTSMTWAGHNHEELIITTSRLNLNRQQVKREPLAGSIFIIRHLGTGGVPDHKFVFSNADNY